MIAIGRITFSHKGPSYRSGARGRDVFSAIMGKQREGGLRKWNGAQLPLLAVSPTGGSCWMLIQDSAW